MIWLNLPSLLYFIGTWFTTFSEEGEKNKWKKSYFWGWALGMSMAGNLESIWNMCFIVFDMLFPSIDDLIIYYLFDGIVFDWTERIFTTRIRILISLSSRMQIDYSLFFCRKLCDWLELKNLFCDKEQRLQRRYCTRDANRVVVECVRLGR